MFTQTLHGQWASDLVLDTLITDTDMEEAIGDIPDMLGDTLDIGDLDGVILDTDHTTDTTTTLIATEEEVQQLIMEAEIMLTTEATTQIEDTQTEITLPIETIQLTEATIQTDKIAIQILEEALLQTEEHIIHPAQISLTEEEQLKAKATVTTILTEAQAILRPEITITAATATQTEATLPAHLAQ